MSDIINSQQELAITMRGNIHVYFTIEPSLFLRFILGLNFCDQ